MKKTTLGSRDIRHLKARHQLLASRLGNFGSLSQGSVMAQPPSAWIWTRKVKGKTVTRGLSAKQAEQMKQAIANYRKLEDMIREMREITQKLILQAPENVDFPPPPKRPKPSLT